MFYPQVVEDSLAGDTSAEGAQLSYQWDNYGFEQESEAEEGTEEGPEEEKTLSPSPPSSPPGHHLAPPTTPVASTSFVDLLTGQFRVTSSFDVIIFLDLRS